MSQFITDATQKFRLLKGEVEDIKGGLDILMFVLSLKNCLLGQPIYVSIILYYVFTVTQPRQFSIPFSTLLPWISHMLFNSIRELLALSADSFNYQKTKGLLSRIACNLGTSF